MPHSPSRVHHGPSCNQSGLTRVEFLVFGVVLLILIAVAWVPLSAHFEKVKIAHAVENAHTLNTVLYQYATDNNGVYPVGEGTPAVGKSEGIARNLLENAYIPDATTFAVGSTPKYAGKASDFSDLTAANLSWDFTAGATATTGLTTTVPDLLPIVYTTGQSVTYPTTPGTGLDLPLTGSGPFGAKGMIVAYKGGNATFILGVLAGTTVTCPEFISKQYKETATYTQIKP